MAHRLMSVKSPCVMPLQKLANTLTTVDCSMVVFCVSNGLVVLKLQHGIDLSYNSMVGFATLFVSAQPDRREQ